MPEDERRDEDIECCNDGEEGGCCRKNSVGYCMEIDRFSEGKWCCVESSCGRDVVYWKTQKRVS